MMRCTLCGCKFDEMDRSPCECSCTFGGCSGDFVICPQCGHHMTAPPEVKKVLSQLDNQSKNDSSIFSKIKQIF